MQSAIDREFRPSAKKWPQKVGQIKKSLSALSYSVGSEQYHASSWVSQ